MPRNAGTDERRVSAGLELLGLLAVDESARTPRVLATEGDAAREVVEDRDDSRKRKRDESPEKGPRPYRPPGAAARAALAGDQGVMLLRTVPAPIQKCFAEGLG